MSTEFPKQWNVETLMQIFAVRPDLLEEFDHRRESLPAAPSDRNYICQPNGPMFDWMGEPRTKRVRITFDGAHLVLDQKEADAYVADLDPGDRANYTLTDVYLSGREFIALPEFDGF